MRKLRPVLSASLSDSARNTFRNVFRRFVVLGAGLLIFTLPSAALAEELEPADDDPFDRPGFYIGVGGSYQLNAFEDTLDDEFADAIEDDLPVGVTNPGLDLEDSGGLNALVGYRLASFFAIELEYEWIDEYDITFEADVLGIGQSVKGYSIEGHTLTANTKWIVPFWRIQPYFLLGGGLSVSDVTRGAAFDDPTLGPILASAGIDVDDGTHTAAAGRAGLGIDLYLTQSILVNAEAGLVVTTLKEPDINDIDDLNYMTFSAGLQYRF